MKKVLSIVLILVMLVLPFSVLIDVKAVGVTFNLDENVTNGKGKKVLNQIANGVTVNNVAANDVLAMYKIADVYYDALSDQISYGFTSDFGNYANTKNPALTVDDYLTTDTEDHSGNADNQYRDDSDFNRLVSDYASYIRVNNISVAYNMTTNHYTSNSEDYYYAFKGDVEAGIYLILQKSNPFNVNNVDGIEIRTMAVYSVMIANVVPSANYNNEWVFEDVQIQAKNENSMNVNQLGDTNINNFAAVFGGAAGNIESGSSLNYIVNKDYMNLSFNYPTLLPGNAHSSIKALVENYTLYMFDIIYPSAMTPDLSNLYFFTTTENWNAKIVDDKYYITIETDGSQFEVEYASVTKSDGRISFDYNNNTLNGFFSIVYNLDIDAASLSTSVAGNTITTISYIVKDPYVDIGSNITKSDIRAAFDSSDANYSSTKSVNIRKAIEKVENTSTLYATGVTINNTNSDNLNLNGSEFAVYESYSKGTYADKLGDNIVMSNGTGSLKGLDPTKTYYLKQVKAPIGYRLYNDKVIVLLGSEDDTEYDNNIYNVVNASDGMYTANVINNPMLSLPFTGGSGTAIYIIIGLIIIIGAVMLLIFYKKKNKNSEIETLV